MPQTPDVGDRVYTVGAPKGLSLSFSDGLVSGIRRIRAAPMLQLTAPISPGSSGGGMFNERGSLIGIITAKVVGGEGLNLAIPIKYVDRLFDVWRDTEECPIDRVHVPDNPDEGFRRRMFLRMNLLQEWMGASDQAYALSSELRQLCARKKPLFKKKVRRREALTDQEEATYDELWKAIDSELQKLMPVFRKSEWVISRVPTADRLFPQQ